MTSKKDLVEKEEEIRKLKDDNRKKSIELENMMVSLEQEKQKCKEIEKRLDVTEDKWKQIVQKYQDQERDFTLKVSGWFYFYTKDGDN